MMTEKEFIKEVHRFAFNMCIAHKDPRIKALAQSSEFLSELTSTVQCHANRVLDRTAHRASELAKDVFHIVIGSL
jgi:hypothetical protein